MHKNKRNKLMEKYSVFEWLIKVFEWKKYYICNLILQVYESAYHRQVSNNFGEN